MRRFLLLVSGLCVLAHTAMSGVISPSVDAVSGSAGQYVWQFSIVNNTNSAVTMQSGAVPNPLTTPSSGTADYFTLYDVGFTNQTPLAPTTFGYVSYYLGSSPAPTHSPSDNPGVSNMTFYAKQDTTIAARGKLSGFQIESVYNFNEMNLFSYSLGGEASFMYYGQGVAATPEPATYALMGAGLLAMGLWARRKRR